MTESIILGGGCFWCVEAIFKDVKGVHSAVSGYAGGHVEQPSYEQVCNKTTGHAEVVDVRFNPDIISLKEILEIFFVTHDPTTPNRQGNDIGPQYRSIVLYQSREQEQVIKQVIEQFEEENVYDNPIVTEVVELPENDAGKFWRAENYHQNYFERNPNQGYCNFVIKPKVAKFRKKFFNKLKEDAK